MDAAHMTRDVKRNLPMTLVMDSRTRTLQILIDRFCQ